MVLYNCLFTLLSDGTSDPLAPNKLFLWSGVIVLLIIDVPNF